MALIPALPTFAPGATVKSAEFNAAFALIRDTVNSSAAFKDLPGTFAEPMTFEDLVTVASLEADAITTDSIVGRRTGVAAGTAVAPIRADLTTPVDGLLGQLYLTTNLQSGANDAARLGWIACGDDAALRSFGVRASRIYLGQNAPAWLGSEIVRVDGTLRASNLVGDGAGLTNLEVSNVTGLAGTLGVIDNTLLGLANYNAIQDNAIAGKAPLVHGHNASEITAGALPWARIAAPARIDFDAASSIAFGLVANNTLAGGGSTIASLPGRPNAAPGGSWRWVRCAHPDFPHAFLPLWVEFNV